MGKRKEVAKSKRKKKKSMNTGKKVLIGFLTILIFVLVGTFTYALNLLNSIKTNDFDVSKEDLGITENENTKPDKTEKGEIKNILLLGIDTAEGNIGRSDAIIIATMDTIHDKLKLTSLIRDTYVNIPGHGYDKLTHAYAFGEEKLALKTINQNFGLDIEDYVKVNFSGMENIIDALGGLDITVHEDEIDNLNEHIRHLSKLKGVSPKYIKTTGEHHLNGLQSTAYARIRYADGGDIKRTERHREVLTLIFEKIKSAGPLKLSSMMSSILPYVETSLTSSEIISLGTKVLSTGISDLQQESYPHLDYSEDAMIDGIYYRTYDEDQTRKQIQDYLYKDIKTPSKSDVPESSDSQ